MHLRNPQAAVPWRDFFTDPQEYKDSFGPNAIAPGQIPALPTNYNVPITFSGPLRDGRGKETPERYPNNDGVQAGSAFTLRGTGMDQYHMVTAVPASGDTPGGPTLNFLVVNLDNAVKPKLGYKIFLANVCNGARDYGEVFEHGCFISHSGYADVYENEPKVFVETLVQGDDENKLLANFNPVKPNDYIKKDF